MTKDELDESDDVGLDEDRVGAPLLPLLAATASDEDVLLLLVSSSNSLFSSLYC